MGNIVWIASYPKSGNTWVRVFLANLLADADRPLALSELSRFADDEALPERYAALGGQASETLSSEQLAALRPRVQARIVEGRSGTVLVKTHNLRGLQDGFPLQHPELTAGAIYVVRNPLDLAVSMSHHFGIGVDQAIDRLCDERTATANDRLFVTQVLGSWSQHVASWSEPPQPRIVVVRYEDLLSQPRKHFPRIARLLGLHEDRRRVERAIRHSGFAVLSAMERRDGFVEADRDRGRFFRRGQANQWREVLNREQIARLVDAHRPQMAGLGYLPPGY
jgi:Sulfotransferase domain.